MSIRINKNCSSCETGLMKKTCSYPTKNQKRAYVFECDKCLNKKIISGSEKESIEYITLEKVY